MNFVPASIRIFAAPLTNRATSRLVTTLRLAAIVVALHAPSWLTALVFQAPRAEEHPVLNLDLLLAAAIACMSPVAGSLALLAAWVADFIRAAAKNYHFMSAMDFVDAARFLDMLEVRTFMSTSLLAMVAGLGLCAWIVLSQTRRARRLAVPLVALVVIAAGFDVANGSFHVFGLDKDSRIVNVNFAGSPVWNVWRSERQSPLAFGPPVLMRNPATFYALRDWQDTHPEQTSMLVLVESMGLPKDPALRGWLLGRLATKRLASRWTIRQLDEEFYGSTTSGELRTLCGLQGHYSRLDDGLASGCLPHRLAARGVTSIGIHGFGLRMFDRNEWWPRIGIKPWHWPEPSQGRIPMNCNNAFPGVCDDAVLDRAVTEAQEAGKFVYALTLDTHLPLPSSAETVPRDLAVACNGAAASPAACQLVLRLGHVMEALERSLAASRAIPFVTVVGDHAPPFGEASNREAFVADRVPLLVLEPR